MKSFLCLLAALIFLLPPASWAAADQHDRPAYPRLADGSTQYATFPKPLETYPQTDGGIMETLKARAKADPFNVAASVIFLLAILHTFAASTFTKLSHKLEDKHEEELKRRGVRDDLHPDGVAEVSFPATALHYLEGFSVREIATVLECSDGTVKTHLHRARQTLAKQLQENDDE